MKFNVLRRSVFELFPFICDEAVEWYDQTFGDRDPTIDELTNALENRVYESEKQKRQWIRNFGRAVNSFEAMTSGEDAVQTDNCRVVNGSILFNGTFSQCQDYINNYGWARFSVVSEEGIISDGDINNYTLIETAMGTTLESVASVSLSDFKIEREWVDSVDNKTAWLEV